MVCSGYNLKSNFQGFLENRSHRSVGFTAKSPLMFKRAKPLSRLSLLVFPRYVFRRLDVENDLPLAAVVTGRMANTLKEKADCRTFIAIT